MRIDSFKKTFVFGICMLLIAVTMSLTINADFLEIKESRMDIKISEANCEHKYDLLIIAPQKFSDALKPLIDHKNRVGISTRLVTLEDLQDQMFWKGRDKQEKIKYFIKEAIENWGITYVLLVGGYRQLPVRYCYNSDNFPFLPEPRFVSDLYYADIYDANGSFSSWDSNNNGVYGEWNGEEAQDKNIDLYPDVYLGRLPCRNKFEVKIVVNKIITYETSTYGQPWFKNMVVVAGDTYPYINDYCEGENDTRQAIDYMDGFNHVKLWASTGDLTFMIGWKIVKAINNGCGFIYFAGHGNRPFWTTNPPNESKWIGTFSIFHIPFLTNGKMLPVCIAPGCGNSKFDVTPMKLLPQEAHWRIKLNNYVSECWSWRLTRKIGGGAIATIGSTGLGYYKEDNVTGGDGAWSYIGPRFFWEYGINGTDIVGEIWGKVITAYLNEFLINWSTPAINHNTQEPEPDAVSARTVQECILLGDPSLKIGGYNLKEKDLHKTCPGDG